MLQSQSLILRLASNIPSIVTAVPVTSSASTAKFMQLTVEKINRIVTMVNTSQAATRQLIEESRSKFKKDQEKTAEKATKKACLSADVVF